MWTRSLRNRIVACAVAWAVGGLVTPLSAQGDSTSLAPAAPSFPHGFWGGSLGFAALGVHGSGWEVPGGTVLFLEGEIGSQLSPTVRLLASGGLGGASAGDFKGSAYWAVAGGRFKPDARGSLYLEAAVGSAGVNIMRPTAQQCGWCRKIFGSDSQSVEGPEMSAPVLQLGIGLETPASRRVATIPQLRLTLGKVTVVGVTFGFSGL